MFKLNIIDFFKKTNTNFWYNHFQHHKNKSRDEILQYQNEKFIELIKYVYNNVPFYANYMRNNKICPNNFRSAQDIELLPIIDREVIRKYEQDLLSKEYKIKHLYKGSSSGTTGIPIKYYKDKNGISAGTAAGYVLRGLSGWKPGDRMIHIW